MKLEIHPPFCKCEKCRSFYTLSNGKVKKVVPFLYSRDKMKTLDCFEYITSKKINKFKRIKINE